MELIRTEGLCKTYQDNGVPTFAVRDVSMTIERGEFTAIAGPSGSGKTTLLNLIGALDVPSKGSVRFEGEDLANKSRKELASFRLAKLGFIFQAYNLIPVLTAAENIEFVLMLHGVPDRERRRRAIQVMQDLGIREYADKRPNEMSGGQQQRVAVARAIVSDPPVVLADEPTANLDSATGHALIDLMKEMNETKGITFIFSSHDSQVLEHARRVVYLHDGRLDSDVVKTT
jgi:putative ABC transport system ATP-binding protein